MPCLALRRSSIFVSHPHGCVSWNDYMKFIKAVTESHTLTGVWVEIKHRVSTLKMRPVTPSRVCELKWIGVIVWIDEISSHPHGCVSWNVLVYYPHSSIKQSHPHGCVSWNCIGGRNGTRTKVTPSRVCELKYQIQQEYYPRYTSHPHGCVSWNLQLKDTADNKTSHPHGCVSWNTAVRKIFPEQSFVTPSRVCELKWRTIRDKVCPLHVTPSRVCELKSVFWAANSIIWEVTPSRVCELKWFLRRSCRNFRRVTPSRVCELKSRSSQRRFGIQ